MTKFNIEPCPIAEYVFSHVPKEEAINELKQIVATVTGQIFSEYTIHTDEKKPKLSCLGRIFQRAEKHALLLLKHFHGNERVMEFGCGFGRLGRFLVDHCRELVGVDVNPLMLKYGTILCPKMKFVFPSEVNGEFDLCYSVATFFHLPPDDQEKALYYMHAHTRTGGRCIVDMSCDQKVPKGYYSFSKKRLFEIVQPIFDVKEIKLFNHSFEMVKK